MKKTVLIVLICLGVISCKNENSKIDEASKSYSQNDGLITMKGDFIFIDNAAVLQTPTEIYGVVIDSKMKELEMQVQPLKNESTDMVPVTVRVKKFEKPTDEEGWPYRVEIKEIIKVEKPEEDTNDVIKLGN